MLTSEGGGRVQTVLTYNDDIYGNFKKLIALHEAEEPVQHVDDRKQRETEAYFIQYIYTSFYWIGRCLYCVMWGCSNYTTGRPEAYPTERRYTGVKDD